MHAVPLVECDNPMAKRNQTRGHDRSVNPIQYPDTSISSAKTRQAAKLAELRQALVAQGYLSLDQQALVLGLGRSTAWTILQANHKLSGLRATTINRILASSQLPPDVERVLKEYIREKCAGLYGHKRACLRHFQERLQTRA